MPNSFLSLIIRTRSRFKTLPRSLFRPLSLMKSLKATMMMIIPSSIQSSKLRIDINSILWNLSIAKMIAKKALSNQKMMPSNINLNQVVFKLQISHWQDRYQKLFSNPMIFNNQVRRDWNLMKEKRRKDWKNLINYLCVLISLLREASSLVSHKINSKR